jgi:hypothetical protein
VSPFPPTHPSHSPHTTSNQTPENKPTSVTTIIRFDKPEVVRALFGGALKDEVIITLYRKRSFQKSMKVTKRSREAE